jgi:hypothetical protein
MRRPEGESTFSEPAAHLFVWVDLGWYTLLTALSNGTNSIFFFFYVFAIIVASSKAGATFGFVVTIVSAALSVLVSYLAPTAGGVDVTRFAMRPLAIVGLGYILAYWGGAEIALKRKMLLLNELSFSNPRFGVDWTIELILRRLPCFLESIPLRHSPDPGRRGRHLHRRRQGSESFPEAAGPKPVRLSLHRYLGLRSACLQRQAPVLERAKVFSKL